MNRALYLRLPLAFILNVKLQTNLYSSFRVGLKCGILTESDQSSLLTIRDRLYGDETLLINMVQALSSKL